MYSGRLTDTTRVRIGPHSFPASISPPLPPHTDLPSFTVIIPRTQHTTHHSRHSDP
jgi:hypothetical protein